MTAEIQTLPSRRVALKALGLTAAGLAVGGGGAWLKTRLDDGARAEAAVQSLQTQLADASTTNTTLDLSTTTLQSQVAQLQGQLNSAISQNAELAASLSTSQRQSADLGVQLEAAQSALNLATAQLARYKELTGLFDLLEGVNLDAVAQTGLSAMAAGFTTTLGGAALLVDGLTAARDLLAKFEKTLPDFDTAMKWLGDQVVALEVGLFAIQSAAQKTINKVVTGLEKTFGGFADFVLDHLPFNIGENVRKTLAATQNVLTSVAALSDAAPDNVLNKISKYVNDGPQSWKTTLVKPLNEKALTPTATLLTQLNDAGATFTTSLNDPVTAAIAQRALIREQIAALRAQNKL
jgi:hypothetical protein